MKKTTLLGEVLFFNSTQGLDGSVVHTVVVKEPDKKYKCVNCDFVTHYCDVLDQHERYIHSTVSASSRPMPKCPTCETRMLLIDLKWSCENCKK